MTHATKSSSKVEVKRGLILVDVQYDFIDGSLAVKGAEEMLPSVLELIAKGKWDVIVASQDFHPAGHISFASSHSLTPFTPHSVPHPFNGQETGEKVTQMLWPDHCVQGTRGAEIHSEVLKAVRRREEEQGVKFEVVQKGDDHNVDGYSAFSLNHYLRFTSLPRLLFSLGITHLTIVGLATDYCVLYTALDALKFHFDVTVVEDAMRGVDAEGSREAVREMKRWGAKVVKSVDELGEDWK